MTTKKRKKTKDVQSLKRQTPKTPNDLQLKKAPMKWQKFKSAWLRAVPIRTIWKKWKEGQSPFWSILVQTLPPSSTLLLRSMAGISNNLVSFLTMSCYILICLLCKIYLPATHLSQSRNTSVTCSSPTLRCTFGFVPKMILRVLTMLPAAIVKMTCLPNMHLKLPIIVPMWLVMCRC